MPNAECRMSKRPTFEIWHLAFAICHCHFSSVFSRLLDLEVCGDLTVENGWRAPARFQRLDEVIERRLGVLGILDELHPRPIEGDAVFQLADVAMGDAPLDDN